MYIYRALINALSAHIIHINLNMIFYTHLELQRCRRDQEEEVERDPQVSPEEIMSREGELGCESWTSFSSGCSSTAVQRTLSL